MAHILIEGLLLTKVCAELLLIDPSGIKKEPAETFSIHELILGLLLLRGQARLLLILIIHYTALPELSLILQFFLLQLIDDLFHHFEIELSYKSFFEHISLLFHLDLLQLGPSHYLIMVRGLHGHDALRLLFNVGLRSLPAKVLVLS